MGKSYIGIDIGGTKCAIVQGNRQGQILKKAQFATAAGGGPAAILEKLSAQIEAWQVEDLAGIGVSCGGPLDSEHGVILSPPNLPGWDHIEIKAYMENRFGVRTNLQNDADACALAEWRFGAGRGCRNMVFLTFGTGMGAGLILNGQLYKGRNGYAGEIGHMRMSEYGPVGYAKPGSFEGFCSGSGIGQLAGSYALAQLQRGMKPLYCESVHALSQVTAAAAAQAAEAGDETALQVYRTAGTCFGRGLAVLMDILNPDIIVAGGIYVRSGHLLRQSMEESIQQEAIGACICPVVPAALGERLGDVGALCTGMGEPV